MVFGSIYCKCNISINKVSCLLFNYIFFLIVNFIRLSELFEKEVENYLKMDPDPFDDRHPSRTKSECNLGVYLKTLFKQEDFINKVYYFTSSIKLY